MHTFLVKKYKSSRTIVGVLLYFFFYLSSCISFFTLGIFAGSQEIKDVDLKIKLQRGIEDFLESNKVNISKVLYGGGVSGVMGMVLDSCRKVGLKIKGYSIERYRKYDEGNGVDIEFSIDDDERLKQFVKNGSVFLALPGGLGTIKEVLGTKDMILESKIDRYIYIPENFIALFTLFNTLAESGMLYSGDLKVIKSVKDITKIRI